MLKFLILLQSSNIADSILGIAITVISGAANPFGLIEAGLWIYL